MKTKKGNGRNFFERSLAMSTKSMLFLLLKVWRKSGHKLCDRFSFKVKGSTYSFI